MSKSSMEYYFEFPASRGLQGNTLILLMNVPGRTLSRVLASDNYGHTLERSQRELNKSRVKKFYEYLVTAAKNKEPFIIPPLVGNCASHVEFEEFGNTNVGVVRFPMDAEIKLFDGQHRGAGITMFWFNKQDTRAVFTDIRAEEHELCDGRRLVISPDLIADFRSLPFADSSFPVVVFDPPHLERVGQSAWMGKKYGRLNKKTWRSDLRAGFKEAFRVLWPRGVLIFKWNETQIPVSQILALTDVKPAIGQRTGKNDKTHWIIFVKD